MTTQHSDLRPTDDATPTGAPAGTPVEGLSAPCCGGPSRRSVLQTAGIAGAGAIALAACGVAEDAANDAVSSATDAASGAVKDAIEQASIPVGGGKVIQDAKVVITQPTEGDFKAFSAVCTHQQCLVSKIEDNVITCTCHGSEFDAATGAVKQGPASQPLAEKKVTIGADGITVS